jgi:hypothetical protein
VRDIACCWCVVSCMLRPVIVLCVWHMSCGSTPLLTHVRAFVRGCGTTSVLLLVALSAVLRLRCLQLPMQVLRRSCGVVCAVSNSPAAFCARVSVSPGCSLYPLHNRSLCPLLLLLLLLPLPCRPPWLQ